MDFFPALSDQEQTINSRITGEGRDSREKMENHEKPFDGLDMCHPCAAPDNRIHSFASSETERESLLGMEIAEAVETVEQANFLKSQGCFEMQGYYFYKPMPVEEFEKLSEKPACISG